MDATYLHYGDQYYMIPSGAIVQYNTQNQLTGYQTSTGETVPFTNMTGLTHDQYMATQIGKVEGVQAAKTSMGMNNVGVQEGQQAA